MAMEVVGAKWKMTTIMTMPPPAKNDINAMFAISDNGEEDREWACAGIGNDDIDSGDNVLVVEENNVP